MGGVVVIAKQKLQAMDSWGERDRRFRLPTTEMPVLLVLWNGLVKGRQAGVDQKVVMPALGLLDSGGNDLHASRSKGYLERAFYGGPVRRCDKEDLANGFLLCCHGHDNDGDDRSNRSKYDQVSLHGEYLHLDDLIVFQWMLVRNGKR